MKAEAEDLGHVVSQKRKYIEFVQNILLRSKTACRIERYTLLTIENQYSASTTKSCIIMKQSLL